MADGITQVVHQQTRTLVKKGHDVTVYTSNALDLHGRGSKINDSEIFVDGVKVRYFPYILRYGTMFFTPSMFYSIRDEVKEFDIIHIHDARCFQSVATAYYSEVYNVPIIYQPHGSYKSYSLGGFLKSLSRDLIDILYAERIFRKADRVIALNQTEAEQYRSMGIRDEKIEIIPNGIDLTEYNDLPPRGSFKERYNIPLENKLILYLGRIHQSKGIDLLIKSFSLVLDRMKYGSTILVIIGPDDGYMNEAKSLVKSMGVLDSVLFIGFVSAEDKRKALVDADIFVTPSFSGFPITFLEACATGTPIITTTLGDNLEWINGKVGYVTLPTATKVADAMHRILLDSDLNNIFSENCRSIVNSKFSIDVVVDKLEHIYTEVI